MSARTVTPPDGKPIRVADAAGRAGIGGLSWNRRLHGRLADHGHYRLTLTASATGQRATSSTVEITL